MKKVINECLEGIRATGRMVTSKEVDMLSRYDVSKILNVFCNIIEEEIKED